MTTDLATLYKAAWPTVGDQHPWHAWPVHPPSWMGASNISQSAPKLYELLPVTACKNWWNYPQNARCDSIYSILLAAVQCTNSQMITLGENLQFNLPRDKLEEVTTI